MDDYLRNIMKKILLTAALTASASLTFAQQSAQLELIGTVGGECGIEVSANSTASKLRLDEGGLQEVGSLDVRCDFDYKVTASSSNYNAFGDPVMIHSNGTDEVEFNLLVAGYPAFNLDEGVAFMASPGNSAPFKDRFPIDFESPGASVPGFYRDTVTFTVLAD